MRRSLLTPVLLSLALVLAAGLVLVWGLGGFDGLVRWAMEQQRAAQNAMAGALRALRAGEPGALTALLGIAFGYGLAHAAGPGHGKLVLGGYGAARSVGAGRLAAIALAASMGQATTAVVLVYGGIVALDWTREHVVGLGEGALTRASTAAIALIGLWLVWRGVRGLVRLRATMPAELPAGAALATGRNAEVCASCGHRHGPTLDEVQALTGWREAAALIAAIAIRPCTGALFLLILTWRMGLEAAGIAGVYAMGLGTAAITVGVAVLSVSARDGALMWTGRLGALRPALPALELAVGILVTLAAVQALRLAG